MNTFLDIASRMSLLVALALSSAGCLAPDTGDDDAHQVAEDAAALRRVLPVPVVWAPCTPRLPPSYPGCYPWPRSPNGPPGTCGAYPSSPGSACGR